MAKHVVAAGRSVRDAGSTPAASTIFYGQFAFAIDDVTGQRRDNPGVKTDLLAVQRRNRGDCDSFEFDSSYRREVSFFPRISQVFGSDLPERLVGIIVHHKPAAVAQLQQRRHGRLCRRS